MIRYINSEIQNMAKQLNYIVKDCAPSTEIELFNAPSLVIWAGESDNTIYNDPAINHMFRAIHDSIHLKTGLGFTPEQEIEMGRLQAAALEANCKTFLAELFYIEIAEQAKYFLKNGIFVKDQVTFTKELMCSK